MEKAAHYWSIGKVAQYLGVSELPCMRLANCKSHVLASSRLEDCIGRLDQRYSLSGRYCPYSLPMPA